MACVLSSLSLPRKRFGRSKHAKRASCAFCGLAQLLADRDWCRGTFRAILGSWQQLVSPRLVWFAWRHRGYGARDFSPVAGRDHCLLLLRVVLLESPIWHSELSSYHLHNVSVGNGARRRSSLDTRLAIHSDSWRRLVVHVCADVRFGWLLPSYASHLLVWIPIQQVGVISSNRKN